MTQTLRLRAGLVLATLVLLGGCDPRRIEQLEEGVATEADVRRQFGEPEAIYDEQNGSRTFEYPRQPEGQTNYMITIGPDGKMSALRQVLKAQSFAKLVPGLDKPQVRRLLGKPAKVTAYALRQEEVWDWRFLDGQQPKLFSATFDPNGRVLSTAITDDLRVAR